ncbi:probable 28S ribosomal protein S23, mitochondrial [Bactrocera neohumeralis]|uniref:probable 28S ribosomal protein S23, mitochondrial n=1 Tax=Bactrocera neohumeralis TaxID=98809 RepID=UPI0021669375|nr:probable 28S ribosomal protein S23, mitochondrial [Bactrocera neohumeralis]
MAQSRLEKIGTIFTRVNGLIKAGAMKYEDRPIWFDLYTAFPPKLEPRFDRPAADIKIKNIFYAEDLIRAKFHKTTKQNETINFLDTRRKTQTQNFIQIYENLKTQNPLDDEKLYETAVELLAEQSRNASSEKSSEATDEIKTTLSNDFAESLDKEGRNKSGVNVDIQKLFSE